MLLRSGREVALEGGIVPGFTRLTRRLLDPASRGAGPSDTGPRPSGGLASSQHRKDNWQALVDTVEFLREREIAVVLAVPPNHGEISDTRRVDEIEQLLSIVSRQPELEDVQVWDFRSGNPLDLSDQHFADASHLNIDGAKVFSLAFAERMTASGFHVIAQ